MNLPVILESRVVSFSAGSRLLLDAVDWNLEQGEVHALAGPNGAGKSTLLRILTGEQRPDRGSVLLAGREVRDWKNDDLARQRACLPQSSTLSFPFTIREVVGIGRIPHRESQTQKNAAIEKCLDTVGLLDRANEGYLHLSGGEKQRVHLARVLAQLDSPDGRVLLLDEPTASLDLTHQQMVFRIAEECARKGAAVVIVLHDLNQVMNFADRVTLLQGGRKVATGRPSDVLTSGRIQSVYGVRSRWIEDGSVRLLALE